MKHADPRESLLRCILCTRLDQLQIETTVRGETGNLKIHMPSPYEYESPLRRNHLDEHLQCSATVVSIGDRKRHFEGLIAPCTDTSTSPFDRLELACTTANGSEGCTIGEYDHLRLAPRRGPFAFCDRDHGKGPVAPL